MHTDTPAPARLLAMHRLMVLMRLAEESFVDPILDGTVKCPVHLYSGQEAVAAAFGVLLTDADVIFGTHRSHGHFLAKGGSVESLVAEIYCREDGCSHGRGGSMHLIDPERGMLGSAPIVAGTISLAAGAAMAAQHRGDQSVAVTFFGDGATGEGVLFEVMNFAALQALPLIFVCENNLYSTHMPIREIRVSMPIVDLAAPFGIRAAVVDGNDAVAMHDAVAEAVAHTRAGRGPYFLECRTYRMRGHVGPNDNIQGTQTDIRPADEVAAWQSRDPIAALERLLIADGISTRASLEAVHQEIAARVAAAHAAARQSPFPSPAELERDVFRR